MSRAVAQPRSVWKIDRHIPIALIAAVMAQAFAATWWASGMAGRVGTLEVAAAAVSSQDTRITRLETKFEGISADLTEIKGLLRAKSSAR